MNPLCFVLMPFGRKRDQNGRTIDFDAVYAQVIAPAIAGARLDPIRADEEQVGGSIHKPMFERLLLCEYAIADLTGANPNVFYELGVRHALRARTTLILFAEGTLLPFDVAPLRGLPYAVDEEGRPTRAEAAVAAIGARLAALRADHSDDSPVYQLIDSLPRVAVDHEKTDIFRERVAYSKDFKTRLADARRRGLDAVREVAADPRLADTGDVEAGILVDVFLSLREVGGYAEMLDLYARMPRPLQRARMVQEQRGFALNRLGRSDEAEAALREVIQDHGPSSETNGLLGRVYKDRWRAARKAEDRTRAAGALRRAIEAYLAGFEADWRDPYPGINALTLMTMQEKPDPRRDAILPVVRYAAGRRAARDGADYWDHATLVELAVLGGDEEAAMTALEDAAGAARFPWELKTSADNLADLATAPPRPDGPDVAGLAAEMQAELRAEAAKLEAERAAAAGRAVPG